MKQITNKDTTDPMLDPKLEIKHDHVDHFSITMEAPLL